MKTRNLATSLRRRIGTDPMRQFDALPPELRRWLAQASLPWSPRSVARLWSRALSRSAGDRARAVSLLDQAEARALARDARRIWGAHHPAGQRSQPPPTGGKPE